MTGESASIIEPFIVDKSISYLIALGGANGYSTTGIPRAWLVNARQEIVWEGHPASLSEAMIEEHLKEVRLVPTFELPKDLKSAEGKLNSGQYSSGIKALERYLEKPDDAEVEKAAREAIKTVNEYGEGQLKLVDEYAESAYYVDGLQILENVARLFKGTEIGDKAKDKQSAWKKDDKIKLELMAGGAYDQAEKYLLEKNRKKAVSLLKTIAKTSKFDDTKASERARAKLRQLGEQ